MIYKYINNSELSKKYKLRSKKELKILNKYLQLLNGGVLNDNDIIEGNQKFLEINKNLKLNKQLMNSYPGSNEKIWFLSKSLRDGHSFYWCLYKYLKSNKKEYSNVQNLNLDLNLKELAYNLPLYFEQIAILRKKILNFIIKRKEIIEKISPNGVKNYKNIYDSQINTLNIGYRSALNQNFVNKEGYTSEFDILAAAQLFKVSVWIYKKDKEQEGSWTLFKNNLDRTNDSSKNNNIMFLLEQKNNHFDSLIFIGETLESKKENKLDIGKKIDITKYIEQNKYDKTEDITNNEEELNKLIDWFHNYCSNLKKKM